MPALLSGSRRRFALTSVWITLANVALVTGLAGVSGLMLWDMHEDAAQRSDAAAHALVQVLTRDINRNVELLDLSLQAVADGIRNPAVHDAEPALKRMILFDRSASARNFGAVLLVDETGTTILSSRDTDPPLLNVAEREYFQYARDHIDNQLHVGHPFIGKLRGKWLLPLSRRLSHPDGSFAGVVRAVIELDYFRDLLEAAAGPLIGRLELYGPDGSVLMTMPYNPARIGVRVADNPSYIRMASGSQGEFHGPAIVGPGEHDFVYARVGALPLLLSRCAKPGAAFADWWWRALSLGGILVALLSAVLGMSRLLQRELERHKATEKRLAAANAKLATLATTDALTGLGNRRLFDDTLDSEWRRAQRNQRSLSLLLLDADWFKGFNDHYGHQEGDEALRLIARSLNAELTDQFDSSYRIGGEEFAVLLPDTDLTRAMNVAERIRALVAKWSVPHRGSPYGRLSVSVGAAEMIDAQASDAASLIAAADHALYVAKELGRNQAWSTGLATSTLRRARLTSSQVADQRVARSAS